MIGVLADVRFPMPAALAFLAVGFPHNNIRISFCYFQLRNIYQFTKFFSALLQNLEMCAVGSDKDMSIQRFTNYFILPSLL